MTRVLYIGQDPATVDFSDPALPPGMNAGKIQAGIDLSLGQMRERGWQADFCPVKPDDSAGPEVARALGGGGIDCVVIGAGLRMPPRSLPLFERVLNAVHQAAPKAAIAFNTTPQDTADAVARWCR
jgi:hypothetical protein